MRRLFTYFGIAVLAVFSGQASATTPLPESAGEASQVLSCFYECKSRSSSRPYLWKEVTTLMLANAGPEALAAVVFSDDDQNIIAVTELGLSELDLDELYVCRTLWAGGVTPVPEAGLIEVIIAGGPLVYGWIKNLVGRFDGRRPEPFKGRRQEVEGIGKTECRVTPPSVTDFETILEKALEADPPFVEPLLIEGTAEPVN